MQGGAELLSAVGFEPQSLEMPPVKNNPHSDSATTDAETEDDEETARTRFWQEYFELLEVAKRKLGEEYRNEGPPLGFEFDEPPPVDEGIDGKGSGKKGSGGRKTSKKLMLDDCEAEVGEEGKIGKIRKRKVGPGAGGGRKSVNAASFEDQLERKRQQEMARAAKKRLDEERRAKRVADKESKKKEKQLLKERERLERERKKQLERAEKERERELKRKQKEEEKLRQQQEREQKRWEKEKEKERKAEERRKQQEEKRRGKELQKVLAAKVKAAQKALQKQIEAGPPDDLDLEWDRLMEERRCQGYGSDTGGEGQASGSLPFERPEFPPDALQLLAAFPKMGDEMGGEVLMVWSFVHSFGDMLCVPRFTVEDLIRCLFQGQSSKLLCDVHVGLLRLLQADMEESHHLVVTQGGGGTANFMDRAVVSISSTLDEAWAWGFDVDIWRAHLNSVTWPEVLRQFSIAAGKGPRRPKAGKESKPKLGTEGEDVVVDESGGLRLKMPSRFAPGTVKAAAWQVLADAGPEGLMISEIAKRIQKQGLRDLRTSKTPEASVAGGLSRDVVFTRVAPATYALQAVVAHHRRLLQNKQENHSEDQPDNGDNDQFNTGGSQSAPSTPQNASPKSMTEKTPSEQDTSPPIQGDDMELSDDEERSEDGDDKYMGEPWIQSLTGKDYDDLTFDERLNALSTLCNMALDGPTLRACLDVRLENQVAEQKRKEAEAKAEKRARREQAAEEAQRRLLEMGGLPATPGHSPSLLGATPSTVIDTPELDGSVVETIMCQTLQTVNPQSPLPTPPANPSTSQLNAIRYEPIGLDRRYNRYWKFSNDVDMNDPCSRCIFVETRENGEFKLMEKKGQLGGLKDVLDVRGAREGMLMVAIGKQEEFLLDSVPSWREKPELDPEYLRPEKRHRANSYDPSWVSCMSTFARRWMTDEEFIAQVKFPEEDQAMLRTLKEDLMRIEQVLPAESLENWDRYAWLDNVRISPDLGDLRLRLGQLEASLVPQVVSPGFNRTPLLVKGAWQTVGGEVACAVPGKKGEIQHLPEPLYPQLEPQCIEPLAWLPPTFSAISLRLLALDAAIMYRRNVPPGRETLLAYKYVQKPWVREIEPSLGVLDGQQGERGGNSVKVLACEPIGIGGRVMRSSLPTLKSFSQGSNGKSEFKIQVDEIRQAVSQAEADGTLYAGGEPLAASRSRGRAYTPRGGRGSRGRASGSKKGKRKSALAMELDKVSEEDDDVSEDVDYAAGGYYGDVMDRVMYQEEQPQYTHSSPEAMIEDDEDYEL